MALERRDVFFGPCFAHQTNLVVGEIFKKSPNLVNASEKAIRIIAYLNKSVYFTARLHSKQKLNIINILHYFFHVLLVGILITIATSVYYEQKQL